MFSWYFVIASSQNDSLLRRGKARSVSERMKEKRGNKIKGAIKLKRPCHGEEQAQCWTTSGTQGEADRAREKKNTRENAHLESTPED